ncbi:Uncharacterized protein TPAR_02484, partial [Tolypocladium paradoxum]
PRPLSAVLPPAPAHLSPDFALLLLPAAAAADTAALDDEAAVLLAIFEYRRLEDLASLDTLTFAELYAAFANLPPLLQREAFERAPRRAAAFVHAVLRRWPDFLGETLRLRDMSTVLCAMRARLDGLLRCGALAEQVPYLVETTGLYGNVERYMAV